MIKSLWAGLSGTVSLSLTTASLLAQAPRDIAIERAGYLDWLKKGANSPLAAVAREPVGEGLWLAPDSSDIRLAGIDKHHVVPEGSVVMLHGPGVNKVLRPGQLIHLGAYTIALSGAPSRAVLTVFGEPSGQQPPGYYDYNPSLVFTGELERREPRSTVVLSADGAETDATEIGSFALSLGSPVSLRVLRVPIGGEESELEIFFRDETNGHGTYPAGRFVSLTPLANGRFRLDFNRARNPYCAYSSLYPCPAPWKGNLIPSPVPAGERYSGGGLHAPAVDEMN
jgi:Protein of unknown function (DUF1684)